MDFPLDLPSTSVPYPFSENVIKLEPLNQLSEPENVEERARALYHHSSDFVQELSRSLSPPPPPPLLNTNAPEKGTDTRSSSPGARTVEMSTQHEAGDEQQLPLSDMTESAIEIQPTTVEVYASQHSSSSSDVLNLPPNQSAAGKDMTQVVGSRLSEAEIQPSIVEVYSTSTVHTNQPQLDLVSHNVGTDQVIGKEGEKEHENIAAPSPTGDQIGDIAMHIVSSPDSSQNLSQEVGPSSWSDSQKRSQDSDVLYSSDSQPPSLKMIRLESPSPTPESSLSPSVVQTDTHSQRQDPEPCHSTIESTPSLLVAQMEAQLPHQQVLEHPDAMNSSPLSQLIAEMDAQPSLQQQDSAHGRMECSSSGGFLYSPPPDGGEEKEGERERIKAPVVAREREESHDKINSGGALRRGDDGRIQLLSMFARSEDYKHKLTAGQWVKADEAASRRGERSTSSSEQRSATKGQSSKSVATVAERPFTSSEQRSRDDESRESHHSGNNLDEGAANLDVPGTQEVDVVGTASQLATLEVDVEGSYSSADKMETAGAAPLRDRPITSPTQVQVQPSGKG